jgi:hypothetical protein
MRLLFVNATKLPQWGWQQYLMEEFACANAENRRFCCASDMPMPKSCTAMQT